MTRSLLIFLTDIKLAEMVTDWVSNANIFHSLVWELQVTALVQTKSKSTRNFRCTYLEIYIELNLLLFFFLKGNI